MKKLFNDIKALSVVRRIVVCGWLILLVALPFHALLSTWGGTTLGPYEVWKVWKDILLLALAVAAGCCVLTDPSLRRSALRSPLVRLCAAYGVLHVVITAMLMRDPDALAYGLLINLRIVLIFLIGALAARILPLRNKNLLQIALVPAVLVIAIGLLQMFVLPSGSFEWFGYGDETIAATSTIDDNPDDIRVMSTLRGPNPLGAYLAMAISFVLAYAMTRFFRGDSLKLKERLHRNWQSMALAVGALLTGFVVLYGTHGRAGWIAAALAVIVVVLVLSPRRLRTYLLALGAAATLVLGSTLYVHRDSHFVRVVILHDNPDTGAEVTSNDAHKEATLEGLRDIKERPLTGCGAGCAGPASFYNNDGPSIAENYYVQIGQEIGVFGLTLFLAILIMTGRYLWLMRKDPVACALLASLVGISAANMFLHVWADDTIAYVWWGLAGAVLTAYTLPDEHGSAAKTK